MIYLNFKTYESGTGRNAISMAKIAEEVSIETGIKIILIAQPTDIREVSRSVSNEVWSQHIDPVGYGAHTGYILPEAVKSAGAVGTVLNHSENRSDNFDILTKEFARSKEVGLKTLIFAKDLEELNNVSNLMPDFISYEPPALIGSRDASVASSEPDIVLKATLISKKVGIPLIVGAGVHSTQDVSICVKLGAAGIAVASDIMKAEYPKKELLKLANGFKF